MLPTRNTMDIMSEINRLFQRPESEDSPPTQFPLNSDLHSTLVNRSSSSTDSTSPESYPDLSFRFRNYQGIGNHALHGTPFTTRPQRAIVGRKILGNSQQTPLAMSPEDRMERDYNFWQQDELLSLTPPDDTLQPKNSFYELFPPENKAFEFKTTIKKEPKMFSISPNFSDRSPLTNYSHTHRNMCNLSPTSNHSYRSQSLSNQSVPVSLLSPTWSNSSVNSMMHSQRHTFMNNSSPHYISKYQNLGPCSSTDEIAPAKMCTFCRKNGETPIVYMTHCVKEQVGGKNVVTCPILRSHVCATCGGTGDNAHTITYCPILRNHNNGKPLQSTTITLKNTRIKSNGRRRY